MPRTLSYRHVIALFTENTDDQAYLEELVMNHKNWGSFKVRLPSHLIVAMIDTSKRLAEEQLGDKIPVEVDADDFTE